ncbi:MAG: hypothetical protein MZV64_22850 [Ignavibacteriales bacterium]|nr:hypothetical protein [Ignavibacteriales bacterium]
MTLNLVRKGVLGEVLHAEAGYLHDLRGGQVLERGRGTLAAGLGAEAQREPLPDARPGPRGPVPERQPRRRLRLSRLDELPVARPPRVRRGDLRAGTRRRPRSATSSATSTRASSRPSSARPSSSSTTPTCPGLTPGSTSSRGRKGLAHKWPDRVYVEGRADKPHQWDDFEKFAAEFEHPLWKAIASKGEGRGHGGMDYIEDYRLIQSLLKGEPLDQDVYDAAAWSADRRRQRQERRSQRPAGRRSRTSPGAGGKRTPRWGSSRLKPGPAIF